MMEILIYIDAHGPCPKKDLYSHVSHNSTMPRKIEALEQAGLIAQTPNGRGMTVSLTAKGTDVAEAIGRLNRTLQSGSDAVERS